MVIIRAITLDDYQDLEFFLTEAGDSLETFRYFDTRSIAVLKNHLLTVLAYKTRRPVGYGHLDKEGDRVWLGVAVTEKTKGMGIGKKIVSHLLNYADDMKVEKVSLTVDCSNYKAVKLYQNQGFVIEKELSGARYIMQRSYDKL